VRDRRAPDARVTDAGRRTGRVTTTGPHYVLDGRAYVAACPKLGASVENEEEDPSNPGSQRTKLTATSLTALVALPQ